MANFIFIQIILLANSGDPDRTLRSLASDLDIHCVHMSHKRMLCLYGLKLNKVSSS